MRAIMTRVASACHLRVINGNRRYEAFVGVVVAIGAIRGAGDMRGQTRYRRCMSAIVARYAGCGGNNGVCVVKLCGHPRCEAAVAKLARIRRFQVGRERSLAKGRCMRTVMAGYTRCNAGDVRVIKGRCWHK